MKLIFDSFKPFKEGMNDFGSTIAIIVNSISLSFVYFLGVGITSFVAKLISKNLRIIV